MADRKSLGIIGHMLGGVTAIVIGIGVFVVHGNITGRYVLVASVSLPTFVR
jgi:hypothetical protein